MQRAHQREALEIEPSHARSRRRVPHPNVALSATLGWDSAAASIPPYSSSSLTSPRAALAFSTILSCSCCGTVS